MTIETYESAELSSTDELPRWVRLLAATSQLADVIAGTDFVPRGLRNNPAAVAATILYGDELGIGPMQSLASIAIVDGRPTPSAELLRALVTASGGELWLTESSDTRVTVEGRRAGSSRTTSVTWTMDQARRAGLASKPNWRNYPRQMLAARATAELARLVWPDAVKGLADSEPLDAIDAAPTTDQAGSTPGSSSAPMRRRRRSPAAGTTEQTTAADSTPPDTPPDPLPPSPTRDDLPAERAEQQANDQQLVRLNIALREIVADDRDAKIRLVSQMVGREISSSKDLTVDEASAAIDYAQGIVAGLIPLPDDEPPPADNEPPAEQ